jgi:purine nucleosidase
LQHHLSVIPILLDTDIGNDIDDALALAYLLRQPRCELVGVTAATGDPVQRAQLAKWLCIRAGKPEIPVAAGLVGPLLTGPGQPHVHQYPAMPASETPEVRTDAIDFMRETIRARPHEITLLAIGPMTSVGALFAADPELPGLLKQTVLMCGSYGVTDLGRPTEWNAHVDPVAAGILFRQAVPGTLTAVGLDVSLACKLDLPTFWKGFEGEDPLLQSVTAMAQIWAEGAGLVYFHDPLAASLIFLPELCRLARGTVDVELLEGETRWSESEEGPHRVPDSVDSESFFEDYFDIVRSKSEIKSSPFQVGIDQNRPT